MIKC
jgi:Leucine-rich repeat (LRR) protein